MEIHCGHYLRSVIGAKTSAFASEVRSFVSYGFGCRATKLARTTNSATTTTVTITSSFAIATMASSLPACSASFSTAPSHLVLLALHSGCNYSEVFTAAASATWRALAARRRVSPRRSC